MRDEYIMYLDESEALQSKTFAIAGFVVKKDQISFLQDELQRIKKLVWSEEYICKNNPILHCTELQQVYIARKSKDTRNIKEEYKELLKRPDEEIDKIYKQLYGRLVLILKQSNATVFSCIIKLKQLNELFYLDEEHDGTYLIDDKYNIALQKVIENYTHYLSMNDGYGDVVYEARNSKGENSAKSPDCKLVNDYHKIQANNKGIVYTDSAAVQSRNRTISVFDKTDNLAGLQIADFIAYNVIRLENCNVDEQRTDFMKQIHRLSYNGGHRIEDKDQRFFWGMRVLPSCLKMETLTAKLEMLAASNKALKNGNANLKKERNRLKKLVEQDVIRIAELESQTEELKKKLNEMVDND